ncbi:MAG: hypothetical protein IMZ57_04235 [Acidobacteria bacterium]|nr:hypothetical protein [Acidobacteriota bacterium]
MNATGGFVAGSIIGKLLLDKTGWNASIKSVDKDKKSLNGMAANIGAGFVQIGKMATVAGAAAAGALAIIVKKTAEAGDAIWDMSQRTGIATETLSGLKLAAEKSGTSIEGVAVGLRFLGRSMVNAADGVKMSTAAFSDLGISVKDVDGQLRPMQDVMLDVADRFMNMENGAAKTALAIKLFGRSGTELIPMLNLGAEGLREQIALAEKLGLVFTEKTAKAADKFKDTMTELNGALTGMRNDIGNALIPVFTQLAAGVTEALTFIRGKIAEFAASGKLQEWVLSAARVFIGAFKLMAESVAGLMLLLPSLKASIFSVSEGFYKMLGKIAEGISLIPGVSAQASVALKVWAADFKEFATVYGEAADDNKNKVLEIRAAAGVLLTALDKLSEGFGKTGTIVKKTFKEMATASGVSVEEMTTNLEKLVSELELVEAFSPVDIPIEFNFFPADEPIDTTFYQDILDAGADLSAKATAKLKEKVVDPMQHIFDGLYNDIATGFANAIEGLFSGLSKAEKKRKADLQAELTELDRAYKAGEISLEEYTEKYKAAHDEMIAITGGFARFFSNIWATIKQAFFRVIGEMVAGFMVNFVKKIIAGMTIVKAAMSAFNASFGIGGLAAGVAVPAADFVGPPAPVAAAAGASFATIFTAAFLAVWSYGFVEAIKGVFSWSKKKSEEQFQAELAWIEKIKAAWIAKGWSSEKITEGLKNIDWWMSEPGKRGGGERWATGFEGIISQPTQALIGEAGPEYVSVQPLNGGMTLPRFNSAPAMAMAGAGGGGTTVTLHLNGPLISTTGVSTHDLAAAGESLVAIINTQLRRVGRKI